MKSAYINLSGAYGLQQSGTADYREASEIVAEMDRLGIYQTVLECIEGNNSLYRNRRLLRDMQTIPDAKRRIIPSFILDPVASIQTGAMDEILHMIRDNRPCCISLYPRASGYRLRLADLFLDRPELRNAIILIDINQLIAPEACDDLIELSARYPEMRFVIRQAMYSDWPILFDIMRKAKNVYADISWMHSREAIRLAGEYLGEERLLYSHGPRATAGASMAALVYAQIPEAQKENIRTENFIQLFSDKHDREILRKNRRAIDDHVANSFWRSFMEGNGFYEAELIDVHTHLGATGGRYYLYDLTFDRQIQGFERDMERFNIRHVISTLSGQVEPVISNDELERSVGNRTDHFHGYIRYDPKLDSLYSDEWLEKKFAGEFFIGLKTLPQYMGVDIRDAAYDRMFRYANAHGMPLLIHCWEDGLGSPLKCAEAAEKWPNVKMILGHTGGGDRGRLECEQIAQDPRYSNVYFEFCGSFPAKRRWEDTLQRMDYRRVLYGTDACLHEIAWELGRLLSADIPDEQLIAILGGNAKRILGALLEKNG